MRAERIAWLDHAKGLCILLVVLLYATELVQATAGDRGWAGAAAAFAQPFRMPAFFLLSALLLPRAIARDWRTFLDRKVAHFAYFYVLWLTLLMAYESPRLAEARGWAAVGAEYASAYVHPFSMLWFIYLLPIFLLLTRLLRRMPPWLVWTAAAALQVADLETGVKVLDKLAAHYVFFHTGYVLAPLVTRLAAGVARRRGEAWTALAIWALVNASVVLNGAAGAPLVSLAMGLAGAAAVVAFAALVAPHPAARPMGYCGRQSLVIYLAFLIPLEATRKLAGLAGLGLSPGMLALACAAGGVLGALALYWSVRGTPLRFLFERPAAFTLAGASFDRKRAQPV